MMVGVRGAKPIGPKSDRRRASEGAWLIISCHFLIWKRKFSPFFFQILFFLPPFGYQRKKKELNDTWGTYNHISTGAAKENDDDSRMVGCAPAVSMMMALFCPHQVEPCFSKWFQAISHVTDDEPATQRRSVRGRWSLIAGNRARLYIYM